MAKRFVRAITPLVRENIKVSVSSIKSNRLRSALTIAMVAIGITSLVGILSATQALKKSVNESFSQMGAGSFTISARYYTPETDVRQRVKNDRQITYHQALDFKNLYRERALVSIFSDMGGMIVTRGEKSTSPNIRIVCADENYLAFSNLEIKSGRDISEQDIEHSSNICILGANVASTLFNYNEDPVNESVTINNIPFKVVGIIKGGSSRGGNSNRENIVAVPVSSGRVAFSNAINFTIGIVPEEGSAAGGEAYSDAEQVFRSVRRLAPTDASDFYLNYNAAMMESATSTLGTITIIAAVIGLITLLGAAVGLMNIMLVSVKERTNEIGVRKAIGASAKLIRQQFLFESIFIAQIGCAIGAVLGIIAGNIVAMLMNSPLFIPWGWILVSIVTCTIVGMASGYLPAKKAASLDPVEAFRYE